MAIMSDAFDPYRKWLGIPRRELPPHHYRLLGIEPFESDPDVIAHAADARMAHLKTFQAGRHGKLSQRLLNEVAEARVCLLNAQKKAEYDRDLRRELSSVPRAAPAKPPSKASAAPMPRFERSSVAAKYAAHRNRAKWVVPVALAAASLAGVALIAFLLSRGREPVIAQPSPVGRAADSQTPPPPPARPPQEDVPDEPGVDDAPDEAAKDVDPQEQDPAPAEPAAAEPPVDAEPDAEPPPVVEPAEPPEDGGPQKAPVPDAARQEEAERRIRQLFADDFAAARTPQQRSQLAAQLVEHGLETSEDRVARFVLLRLGSQLAAESGNLTESIRNIDRLGREYQLELELACDDDDTLGVAFRVQGPQQYYLWAMDSQRGHHVLARRDGPSYRVLAVNDRGYEPKRWYKLRIELRGSKITVSVDAQEDLQAADATFPSGAFALYSWGCAGSKFRNIRWK